MAKLSKKISLSGIKKAVVLAVLSMLITGMTGLWAPSVLAADAITISNILVTEHGKTATIAWTTNRPTIGRVDYGLLSNKYNWALATNQKVADQVMTISGLDPETTYYFRITATDDSTSGAVSVQSFEHNFKTTKFADTIAPTITKVSAIGTTGTTATIQWLTDKNATSEIEYGLTTAYGSRQGNGSLVTVHDITITGLRDDSYYHARVISKDKNNNISRSGDITFKTVDKVRDRDPLVITDVRPTSANDDQIGDTTAIISWRSTQPGEGTVRYGKTTNYGSSVTTNPPRSYIQSVTLTKLTAGTTYYFEIEVRDVINRTAKKTGYSFTTKGGTTTTGQTRQPVVAGSYTCDIDLKKDTGFFGLYYNLPNTHPDVELYHGSPLPKPPVGRDNDWYSAQYFAFNRIDQSLKFGRNFFPVNENLPGDPNHFAVNWRAIIDVPQDGSYSYAVTSDDDSWVLIDGELISDLGGYHGEQTDKKTIQLTKGYHTLEIFYADRQKPGATFTFDPDSRLIFRPLPEGCTIDDVVATPSTPKTPTTTQGTILGASTETPVSAYACNPDLGYTPIKALYKTKASPDVWAILVTGQKHYITSPRSFNLYQCDWHKIKTVSQSTLNRYPTVNLVRTPIDTTVYHLFQRADHKWLKINITSPTVFISYAGNYWGNVAWVTTDDVQAYPMARLIKTEGQPIVYLLENNTKRPIADSAVFERLNFEWSEVVELNHIHLNTYPTGDVVR